MNNQLKIRTKTLPQTVYAYLTSLKSDNLNALVSEKYKFTLPQLRAYYDLVAELFLKDVSAVNLVEEIKHVFGYRDNVARQLACDIAGVRLLVVAEWLNTDIAGLIKSWGGDPARYQSHVEAQQKAIVAEAAWEKQQWAEPVDPGPVADEETWQEKEVAIRNVLSQGLKAVLSLDDDYLLGELNDDILYLIANNDKEIKDEFANDLLNNQELLTDEKIILDGKQVEPTVANWLAYFFSQKGSGLFDALALSDFVTNSANAKSLNTKDKQRLSILLMVYRNLKFFPDSMSSNNPNDWFIFPLIDQEIALTRSARVATAPSIDLAPEAAQFSATSQSAASMINPQIAEQIKELVGLAERYPVGSLERLSLEEEIARLKK